MSIGTPTIQVIPNLGGWSIVIAKKPLLCRLNLHRYLLSIKEANIGTADTVIMIRYTMMVCSRCNHEELYRISQINGY